jgi:predicted transcriptional regulator
MAFTQTQLDALEEAIAQGVLKVKYQDREVTYNSFKQMTALREMMRRELGLTEQTVRMYAKHSKGTC